MSNHSAVQRGSLTVSDKDEHTGKFESIHNEENQWIR